uniref:Xylulose kinase-1 n=1 Tax=Tanacetum cinerariifolium TaxID=118510 RepID=A0A6L2M534_TANCI|nr:hypothetical protein [Tanacetum cinerariifolium]
MSTPTFAKTHNLIAFLEKPSESDGFEKIVDFLNANQIKYALTVSPTIYTSCIKQFWTNLKIKTVNDNVRLQALIDGKKVVIIEASIRHDLKLNDTEGIFFNPSLTKKVFANIKRVGTGFSGVVTLLFDTMMVQPVEEVGDLPTSNQDTSIPDAPSSSQPQRKHNPRKKEKKERKETEVSPTELPTEDPVPTTSNDPLPSEMKSSHKAKIAELESRVEKLEEENMSLTKELKSFNFKVDSLVYKETFMDKEKSSKQGRKIPDINADAEKLLKMVEVITIAKITVDEVSTVGGELNAADEELVSAAPTNITTSQPSEATKTTVDITTAPKAKGIVFHDVEESTTRIDSLKAHVKDKGKAKLVEEPKVLKSRKAQNAIDEEVARRIEAEWNADIKDNIDWNKNMAGFKMEFFKGMSYKEIRPLFEKEYNKVKTLFKEGPEMDVERIKDPRKRTRKKEVEKDQTAKKKKGDELEKENAEKQKLEEQQEAKELKRNLEIVPDDEDDVFMNVAPLSSKPPTIVDYKIYKERKKEHFQIIRENGNHKMYLAFSTMLKNFDREDLEVLSKIVKDRFNKSQPKEVLDVFLWHTLKVMFEHYVEDNMFNNVRLQVDYGVEMVYDLLRLVRKQLREGYMP